MEVGEGDMRWGLLLEGWERGDEGLLYGLLPLGRSGC